MTTSADNRPRRAALAAALLGIAMSVTPAAWAEPVSLDAGGQTLHAELTLPDGGTLADGIVLIVHGTLATHRMELVESLQAALLERGIGSLAPSLALDDAARTGMRDCTLPHRHRHQDALTEIDAWMQWLTEHGTGPVTLLGHSRGGNQAAWYAAERQPALRALVLLAPATDDPEREAAAFARRHGRDLATLIEQARSLPADTMMDDVPFLYCAPTRVSAGTFLSYYADEPRRDTPSLLPGIATPTLVVAAGADTTVPDVAERTAALVDDDTVLVVVEGADHFFRDLFIEDVADAIDEFLERHPP